MNSRQTGSLATRKPKEGGWLAVTIAVVLVLVVVIGVGIAVVWESAPAFVAKQFEREARALGFEEARIKVSAVEMERFEARELFLRRGGVSIAINKVGASFLPEQLMAGYVKSTTVDGLVITLDFTQERRGLLPDALVELAALLKEGEGDFRWPVGTLQVSNARLELVFDGNTYPFSFGMSSDRNLDGQQAFEVDLRHPELRARLEGMLDVESRDGEVELTRFRMAPSLLAELAEKLGSYSLPPNSKFDSDRIRASGTLQIEDGRLGAGEVRAVIPRLRWSYPGLEGELSTTVVEFAHKPGSGGAGKATGDAIVYGTNVNWSAGPLDFEATMNEGGVKVQAMEFPVAWSDLVEATVSISAGAGVPVLGGEPEFRARVIVNDGTVAGHAVEPTALGASGWTDSATIEVSEMDFRDLPVGLRAGVVTATGLDEEVPTLRGHVDLIGEAAGLSRYFPKGYRLVSPEGRFRIGRIDFGTPDSGPDGDLEAEFHSRLEQVAIEGEGIAVSWSPDVLMKGSLMSGEVSATMDAGLERIEVKHPLWPEGLDRASMRADVRDLSLEALSALLKGGAPNQDVKLTSVVSTLGAEIEARGTLAVEYDRETQSWSADHHLEVEDLSRCIPGVDARDLALAADTRWQSIPHAEVLRWLEDADLDAVRDSLLRRAKNTTRVTASHLAWRDEAAAEWFRFELAKIPAEGDGPPLRFQLEGGAGALRAAEREVTQPMFRLEVTGESNSFVVEGTVGGEVEGFPINTQLHQNIEADWEASTVAGRGSFEIEPVTLQHSDIVGKWVPQLREVVIDGRISASGHVEWNSGGAWSGSAEVTFADGAAEYLPQRIRAEGISGGLTFPALPNLATEPGQVFRVQRLDMGDLGLTDGIVQFRIHDADSVHVEQVRASVFDGVISAGDFTVTAVAPDLVVDLKLEKLDLEQIGRFIKPFEGRMDGRLNGQLPVGWIGGELVLGEGRLELDESTPATFSYPASGVFTANLSADSLTDQMNRLPYELLEEGLQLVKLDKFRVDLFRRDLPGTPIRVELSGRSETERATVPFEITTNVNGTVAQVLNLFLRLATL